MTSSNNLTSHLIRSRNNASAALEGNLEGADPGWFDDPSSGALADCTNGAVVGQGVSRPEVADDIDL
ncbi:MAG: hypothetical protein AAFS10_24590 [Myxococcota bacterium]